ncbi:unnamed protein product [Adineta ricciae]|uniref:Uncharacterized protein n=2 Tax=Adineta ricciae TaxID=249248 RepID=A0A814E197_ADIRI|nr:unnamed protein product [Adineta ricciae]
MNIIMVYSFHLYIKTKVRIMALAMNTTITISCEESEEQSGPTIVHSTGVKNYRIQPEIIQFLQESCGNEKLCDHEKGVQCTDGAAHVLETFKRAGFSLTSESKAGSRKLWMLTKTDEGGSSGPAPSGGHHPTPAKPDEDENPADGGDEEPGEEEEEEEEEK